MEAHLRLVCGSVFKTDGAPRERRHGGFDSHALPPLASICDSDGLLTSPLSLGRPTACWDHLEAG